MTRILHILDHSLPMHSGYTFRTRAILKAQLGMGLDVRGLTGLRHQRGGPSFEDVDGIRFHRTAGEASGPPGLREWREVGALADAIVALSEEWRPDVLHAHSPALCGLAAVRAALHDAGVQWPQVQAAYVGTAAIGMAAGRVMFRHLGSTGLPVTQVENASASGSAAFRMACLDVASGESDIALARQ